LIVLTNRGTAAAAEVAAAALQGDKRATLVGERTYGDASILRPITMDDGSAIILSVAKYYSPAGKSIQDNGVTPEEIVADADASAAAEVDDDAEPAPQANPVPAEKKPSEDVILQKAIQMAR
jgi:carboxyl-terminal processing protease